MYDNIYIYTQIYVCIYIYICVYICICEYINMCIVFTFITGTAGVTHEFFYGEYKLLISTETVNPT